MQCFDQQLLLTASALSIHTCSQKLGNGFKNYHAPPSPSQLDLVRFRGWGDPPAPLVYAPLGLATVQLRPPYLKYHSILLNLKQTQIWADIRMEKAKAVPQVHLSFWKLSTANVGPFQLFSYSELFGKFLTHEEKFDTFYGYIWGNSNLKNKAGT